MKKIIASFALLAVAFFCQSFFQTNPLAVSIQNGQSLYATYCISCHMEDGNGIEGVFPSLVKTGNLSNNNRVVKVILQGVRGPIVVKGIPYNAEMAGVSLTDKEVSDVVNYIRNSWGNKAPQLKVSDVAVAKKAVVKGYTPY